MTKIIFKNLKSSTLAKKIVLDRIQDLVEKFPDLKYHQIRATLSMNNSSTQAGPDEFRVKYHITGRKFSNVLLEKKAKTLYKAVAHVNEAALELLNRTIDRLRVKNRSKSRKLKYDIETYELSKNNDFNLNDPSLNTDFESVFNEDQMKKVS